MKGDVAHGHASRFARAFHCPVQNSSFFRSMIKQAFIFNLYIIHIHRKYVLNAPIEKGIRILTTAMEDWVLPLAVMLHTRISQGALRVLSIPFGFYWVAFTFFFL
jgi:hypothetical protein